MLLGPARLNKIAAKRPGINNGEEKNNPGVAPERNANGQLRSKKLARASTSLMLSLTPVQAVKFRRSGPGDANSLQYDRCACRGCGFEGRRRLPTQATKIIPVNQR